jgi:Ca2+:H+ antiporter
MMSTLLVLAAAAIAIPTIATSPGGPAHGHETELSVFVSIVLLVVFAASVPFAVGKASPVGPPEAAAREHAWPPVLAVATLLAAGVGAAFVSDWFVDALKPAMSSLGMSETFAGLVVVAIAGNAVENVVGVQAMLADKGDLAISVILNSSLQVALALAPVLVLVSLFMGGATLTLVVSPSRPGWREWPSSGCTRSWPRASGGGIRSAEDWLHQVWVAKLPLLPHSD